MIRHIVRCIRPGRLLPVIAWSVLRFGGHPAPGRPPNRRTLRRDGAAAPRRRTPKRMDGVQAPVAPMPRRPRCDRAKPRRHKAQFSRSRPLPRQQRGSGGEHFTVWSGEQTPSTRLTTRDGAALAIRADARFFGPLGIARRAYAHAKRSQPRVRLACASEGSARGVGKPLPTRRNRRHCTLPVPERDAQRPEEPTRDRWHPRAPPKM
jgi:hypothetical protein